MIAKHVRWVDTGGAEGARAEFVRADLSGLDLSGSRLVGAVFKEAKLRGTKLISASLNLSSFLNSDLSGADLSNAELRGVRFDQSALDGVNFGGADLSVEIVRLSATKSAEHPSMMSACTVVKANFTGASSRGLIIKDMDLAKALTDAAFLDPLKTQ
jgi:uncharacterized protein YjbI with pentapeptide repeats